MQAEVYSTEVSGTLMKDVYNCRCTCLESEIFKVEPKFSFFTFEVTLFTFFFQYNFTHNLGYAIKSAYMLKARAMRQL